MTRATFSRAGTRPNAAARDARRCGDPATWLVAGAATAGVVAAAIFRPTRRSLPPPLAGL